MFIKLYLHQVAHYRMLRHGFSWLLSSRQSSCLLGQHLLTLPGCLHKPTAIPVSSFSDSAIANKSDKPASIRQQPTTQSSTTRQRVSKKPSKEPSLEPLASNTTDKNASKEYQSFASQFLGEIDPNFSRPVAGRSWRGFELRDKSTTDLKTLFFILVKEKNTLLSIRRALEKDDMPFTEKNRARKVKQSLARLRTIFSERDRKHQAAILMDQKMMIAKYKNERPAKE